jgi:hypothetical protein
LDPILSIFSLLFSFSGIKRLAITYEERRKIRKKERKKERQKKKRTSSLPCR